MLKSRSRFCFISLTGRRSKVTRSLLALLLPLLPSVRLDLRGGTARCILICTLTDSFPILIYKQITPLFKFSSRKLEELPSHLRRRSDLQSFCRFCGLSLIPRTSRCREIFRIFAPLLLSVPSFPFLRAKSPLVILSLKTVPRRPQVSALDAL